MLHFEIEEMFEFTIHGREWRWQYSRMGSEGCHTGWLYQLIVGDTEICSFSSTSQISEFEGTFQFKEGWASKVTQLMGTLIAVLLMLNRKL